MGKKTKTPVTTPAKQTSSTTTKKTSSATTKTSAVFENIKVFDITKNIQDEESIKDTVMYDYYPITIYKRDLTPPYNSNPDIKSPINFIYQTSTGSPNIFYPTSQNPYVSQKIYLSDIIHDNIKNVTIDAAGNPKTDIIGELVIENKNNTGYEKLYCCFLLKKSTNNTEKEIDKIINLYIDKKNATSLTIDLNSVIPKQDTCIAYKDDRGNNILVFTVPVSITSNTYTKIKNMSSSNNTVLTEFPSDRIYKIIKNKDIVVRNNEEIYIDCNPTGVGSDTIASYNVPINSEYTKDSGKLEFMRTTMQMSLITMILVIVYFGSPILYKMGVIDNVNKFVLENNENKFVVNGDNSSKSNLNMWKYLQEFYDFSKIATSDNKVILDAFVRIQTIDIYLCSYMIIFSLILLIIGISDGYEKSTYFIYFFIVFLVSFVSINISKNSKSFLKTYINGKMEGFEYPPEKDGNTTNKENLSYFPFLSTDDLFNIFPKYFPNFISKGYNGWNITIISCLTMVLLGINFILYMVSGNLSKNSIMVFTILLPLLFITPIVGIISLSLITRGGKGMKIIEDVIKNFFRNKEYNYESNSIYFDAVTKLYGAWAPNK